MIVSHLKVIILINKNEFCKTNVVFLLNPGNYWTMCTSNGTCKDQSTLSVENYLHWWLHFPYEIILNYCICQTDPWRWNPSRLKATYGSQFYLGFIYWWFYIINSFGVKRAWERIPLFSLSLPLESKLTTATGFRFYTHVKQLETTQNLRKLWHNNRLWFFK